jgi:hypothetical protein
MTRVVREAHRTGLILRSGAEGDASRRRSSTQLCRRPEASFETPRSARLLRTRRWAARNCLATSYDRGTTANDGAAEETTSMHAHPVMNR